MQSSGELWGDMRGNGVPGGMDRLRGGRKMDENGRKMGDTSDVPSPNFPIFHHFSKAHNPSRRPLHKGTRPALSDGKMGILTLTDTHRLRGTRRGLLVHDHTCPSFTVGPLRCGAMALRRGDGWTVVLLPLPHARAPHRVRIHVSGCHVLILRAV